MGVEALAVLDQVLMVLLLVLVVVCGITDLLQHKIWNKVTLPAMGLGVVLNLAAVAVDLDLGLQFLLASLTGLAVGFGIFFLIYLFGGMGGGDVKFVAAIGALDPFHFGYLFVLWVVFYSVLAGGLIALVVMTLRGRLLRSLRNVFRTLFTFVTPGLEHEPLRPEDSETVPFGLGISLGTLWAVLLFLLGELP